MRKLAILFVVVVMTGCAGNDTRTFTGLSTTPADARFGTAIYTFKENRGCPSKWPKKKPDEVDSKAVALVAAPLIAAGVSIAATFVVNSINRAMEEYKKGLSASFGATGISEGDPKSINCIVIVRGLMGKAENPQIDADEYLTRVYPELGFREYPTFYLELSAIKPDEKDVVKTEAVKLYPINLSYAASSAKNSGSGRKHVGIALAYSDTVQKGTDEINEEKTFAVFRHDLGRLEIGKSYSRNLLRGTDASATITEESLKKSAFNITAVVSESEDPGIAFQVLAETFSSKKSDLQKALEETITNALNKKKDE